MNGGCRIEDLPSGNKLLPVLLILFALIHILLLMYFGHRFSEPKSIHIELNLDNVYQLKQRQIPRPRMQPQRPLKTMPKLPEPVAIPNIPPVHPTGAFKPFLPRQTPNLKVPERFTIPAPVAVPLEPKKSEPPPQETNSRQYLDIIRTRINAHKIYPESARKRMEEGSVLVRFMLTASGQITSIEVIGGASSETLRGAATDAVMRAAPFPVIPKSIGKDSISIKLTIHFKLERQ